MTTSWTAIASNTVGSGGVASVTFSSIPGTYTDLLVKGSTRSTFAGNYDDLNLQFNGSNISRRLRLGATATTTYSDVYNLPTPGLSIGTGATASTFSNFELYIPNYTSSNYKSMNYDVVTENNATDAIRAINAAIWNSTSAITSISFFTPSANLVQYSTFTLFGIKNT